MGPSEAIERCGKCLITRRKTFLRLRDLDESEKSLSEYVLEVRKTHSQG